MSLSIIINNLNDHEECRATIASALQTSPAEIVVVDDGSQEPFRYPEIPQVRLIRNDIRRGGGASRHQGAEIATGSHLLLVDSHMRFEPGWYEKAMARIEGRPNTIHCGSCMGLGEGNMELILSPTRSPFRELPVGARFRIDNRECTKTKPDSYLGYTTLSRLDHTGRATPKIIKTEISAQPGLIVDRILTPAYSGATFQFFGPDPGRPNENQILEGIWKTHPDDDCEIACLMGACYFFPRELFFRLGGLKNLREWGSEETYMSLKAWLSGAEIRFLKHVKIGHKFRDRSPYSTRLSCIIYNKIRTALVCLNPEEAQFLISKFPQDQTLRDALRLIEEDRTGIEEEQKWFRSIKIHDLSWLCEKFSIRYPQ